MCALIRLENRGGGPDSAKFPVNFPVSREFGAETGSQLTGSSATQSGLWEPCPARVSLRDIPAAYGDGGGSLWRVFLVQGGVRRNWCLVSVFLSQRLSSNAPETGLA